jgi:hypothetical protein
MKTAAGYVTDDENIHWASISLAWMGSMTRDPLFRIRTEHGE